MAEALYRKYRPQIFEDVVGQEHIERTLKNAIANDKVSHAYLFCGPRGTGKTTTARLLAKALLCENGPTDTPDGTCEDCQLIAAGEHPDVYELDAASRTGVENVREEIINRVQYAPTRGRYKVYIIDEVHMLSVAAFNALLKTLEEPPSHVVFILATTDPQKVPETIHSRCQRFDFRRISVESLVSRLGAICAKEGVEFEGDALDLIARQADGGMRNALTSLEQMIAFGEGSVTLEMAERLLGTVDSSDVSQVVEAIGRRDAAACFRWTAEYVETGADFSQFVKDLAGHLRNLYVLSVTGGDVVLDVSTAEREALEDEMGQFGPDRLAYLLGVMGDLAAELRTSTNPRLSFEIALTRMVRPEADLTMAALAARLEALEAQLAAGALGGVAEGALGAPAGAYAVGVVGGVPAGGAPSAFADAFGGQLAEGAAVGRPAASVPAADAPGADADAAPQAAVAAAPAAPAGEQGAGAQAAASGHASAPQGSAAASAAPAQGPASAPQGGVASGAGMPAPAVPAQGPATASQGGAAPNAGAPMSAAQSAAASSPLPAQPAYPAPVAAPAGGLSASLLNTLSNPASLQRLWQTAQSALKKAKAAYGVLFMNTKAIFEPRGSELIIEFHAESDFAFQAVQKPEILAELHEAVRRAAGSDLAIGIRKAGSQARTIPTQPLAAGAPAPASAAPMPAPAPQPTSAPAPAQPAVPLAAAGGYASAAPAAAQPAPGASADAASGAAPMSQPAPSVAPEQSDAQPAGQSAPAQGGAEVPPWEDARPIVSDAPNASSAPAQPAAAPTGAPSAASQPASASAGGQAASAAQSGAEVPPWEDDLPPYDDYVPYEDDDIPFAPRPSAPAPAPAAPNPYAHPAPMPGYAQGPEGPGAEDTRFRPPASATAAPSSPTSPTYAPEPQGFAAPSPNPSASGDPTSDELNASLAFGFGEGVTFQEVE